MAAVAVGPIAAAGVNNDDLVAVAAAVLLVVVVVVMLMRVVTSHSFSGSGSAAGAHLCICMAVAADAAAVLGGRVGLARLRAGVGLKVVVDHGVGAVAQSTIFASVVVVVGLVQRHGQVAVEADA